MIATIKRKIPRKGTTMKNLFMFVIALLATSSAFAQEATKAVVPEAAASLGGGVGLAALGIGLMLGLAVLGGALGQSNAASAALEGIARNPSAAKEIRGNLILALALMESLVLFAFLIALFLQGPIGSAIGALVK